MLIIYYHVLNHLLINYLYLLYDYITDKVVALPHPLCDLNLMDINNKDLNGVYRLTALQDGGALVYNRSGSQHQVVRVDKEGQTVPPIYTCKQNSDIRGIINYNDVVFILQYDGYITKYNIKDVSNTVVTYNVDVCNLRSGTLIEYNQLLLPDFDKNEVFVYNTDGHSKHVVITDVNCPVSVACNQDHSVIAVCEFDGHCVSLYNRSYIKQTTIGSPGKADGCLLCPYSVIFTPSGSLLVADSYNHRVCEFSQQGAFIRHVDEFSQQGAFIRHVITSDHDIHEPWSLSYSHPHLWVACTGGKNVKRFTIYEN